MIQVHYMSCTTILYPAFIRLFAILDPIFPSPMNPTVCKTLLEADFVLV